MNNLNNDIFATLADELKLNQDAFNKQMNDQQTINKVREDWKEGMEIGIQGTPTVFVNGRILKELNIEGFSTVIEKILEGKK